MKMNRSVQDYPEHLNPFDDNYDGVPHHDEPSSRHKYNTWSGKRGAGVKLSPSLASTTHKDKETSWSAGKSKLVRRLSFLKTAVERVSFRRKRGQGPPPRSNSLHEDMSYRITSPKVKERLRLQALPALAKLEQAQDSPSSLCLNGRLPPSLEGENLPIEHKEECVLEKVNTCSLDSPVKDQTCSLDSPVKDNTYSIDGPVKPDDQNRSVNNVQEQGVRPKRRKKKPPPPPPPVAQKLGLLNGLGKSEKPEDSISTSSSITQELERVFLNGDNDSLAEFEFERDKLDLHTAI